MEYNNFLESKRHTSVNFGIEPDYYPDAMFDYQRHITDYAIRKGRCACFIDTGLGKTMMELTIAQNYARHTNKPVLIITPLAVAFQFVKECDRFGIGQIEYSKDGNYKSDIVVCNYERLDKFSASDFDCVILDESSILKNFDGAIKSQVTAFLKKIKYRFLFTATPSPNDYIELGTSSEALGYLGYMDMLGKFFKNNQNNVAKLSQISKARQGEEWYLKPHAEKDFWRWVSSWSISMRKPSDHGFSDDRHVLPKLHENIHQVQNTGDFIVNGQAQMFNFPAVNFHEIKAEVRATIKQRCEMAVKLAMPYDTSVYWVNLNDEADMILQMDKSAKEVKGKMSIDEKEEILMAFSFGEIKKLITKTSITAFGLNWQHCNHTTYFPTFSYEQYYQAIRRFYRFGQKRNVFADLVISDGQTRIMESLKIKKDRANQMFENLVAQTSVDFVINKSQFEKKVSLPKFI
jgi:plasmid maintenance system antidote protein VapI